MWYNCQFYFYIVKNDMIQQYKTISQKCWRIRRWLASETRLEADTLVCHLTLSTIRWINICKINASLLSKLFWDTTKKILDNQKKIFSRHLYNNTCSTFLVVKLRSESELLIWKVSRSNPTFGFLQSGGVNSPAMWSSPGSVQWLGLMPLVTGTSDTDV